MNIFEYRDQLVDDLASYVESFLQIRDPAISFYVQQQLDQRALWPDLLIQLNPLFARGASIKTLTIDPMNYHAADACHLKGLALLQLDEYEKALKALDQALVLLDPASPVVAAVNDLRDIALSHLN